MSIFANNRMARPLGSPQAGAFRSGSLGHSYAPSLRGLGAALGVASTIPGDCWDAPGFQDCHGTWFAQAQKDCQGGEAAANFGGDMDTCTDIYADQYSIQNCVPKFCASTLPKAAAGGLTAAQVLTIQKACNTALAANGYKTIAADGKLGPATCGAASFLLQYGMSTVYTDYNMSAYCKSWTNPTKVGSTVPMQSIVLPEDTAAGPAPAAPAWGVASASVTTLQAQVNTQLDAQGFLSIPLTGVLDAATCGAMKWLKLNAGYDLLTTSGSNCQAYVMPTKKPAAINPAGAPKGSPPPSVAPKPPTPPSAHPLTSASMLTGGVVALAAGGLYYWAKKKGMV